MSADPDKDKACPDADKVAGAGLAEGDNCQEPTEKKRKKPSRSVRFPDENHLVTQYFEPANPWQNVPSTTRAQLAAEYLEACRRHNTVPIDSVLQQIRELPECSIGGAERAARLALTACSLAGAAPADALEALLKRVRFRRLEIQHCELDDEGAEAIFDMVEYYESAYAVCISGPRQFGIRGWQAACRMIKKSAELSELEVCESELCPSHAPVLTRALRPHTCRLRALCLQRAALRGEPLLCLVIALKSNTSIRELRLPDNQLTPHDAHQLASVLRLNMHIQLLDLSNNEIQDTGAGYIAEALVEQAAQTPPSAAASPLSPQHYPLGGYEARLGLAFLVLWNNQLTRNCAPHLSKALRSSQSLCVLNIGRNALGGECVRALQCGALLSLGLQSARLGPQAAAAIAELLTADTKLQRLDLRDNRLGVAGLQAIYNAMQENTTLTQIDLDDPAELPEDESSATVAQLSRDIAALCRRNEPPATEPERRVHRKISLTCHTAFIAKSLEPPRRAPRLRSPAPSPAPSPVPHNHHHSRFSVTRVTPERESSVESSSPSTPTRPSYCIAPSRFKVVQVAEPPQIQVHSTQKRTPSRFSVTRNYDAMYNPSPPSGSPSASPSPSLSPVPSPSPTHVSPTPVNVSPTPVDVSPSPTSLSPIPVNVLQTDVNVSPTPISVSALSVSVSPTRMDVSPSPVHVSPIPVNVLQTEVNVSTKLINVTPTPISVSPLLVSVSPTPMGVSVAPVSPELMEMSPANVLTEVNVSPKTGTMSPMPVNVLPKPVNVLATPASVSPTPIIVSPTPIIVSPMPASSITITGVSSATPTTVYSDSTVKPTIENVALSILPTNSVLTASPTCGAHTPTAIPLTSNLSRSEIVTSISKTGIVTPTEKSSTISPTMLKPEIKTDMTCAHTDVLLTEGDKLSPIVPHVSPTRVPILSLSSEASIEQYNNILNVETGTEDYTRIPNSLKFIASRSVRESLKGCLSKTTLVGTNPVFRIGTVPVEDIWKNEAVTLSTDLTSTVIGTTSSITITGNTSGTSFDTLSGTSLATVSGITSTTTTNESSEKDTDSLVTFKENLIGSGSELLFTRSEPMMKCSETSSLANICQTESSTNVERKFEPTFDPTFEMKDETVKIAPSTRFSISPDRASDIKPIDKTVAIGSHTNLAISSLISNNPLANIEADILTKLAEITETIGPKVVEIEPNDIPKTIDLVKNDNVNDKNTMTSISRDMDKESKLPLNLESISLDVSNKNSRKSEILAKSITDNANNEFLKDTSVSTNNSNLTNFSEQTRTEKSPSIDVLSTSDAKQKESAENIKESTNNRQIDKIELKSKTDNELKRLESKPDKTKDGKTIEVVKSKSEIKINTKLEDEANANSTGPESDKNNTKKCDKSDDVVKNKTYSDVVKSDPKYKDKSEQLTHKEVISDSVLKTETKLVKNSVEMRETDKIDVQIEVTVKKESVQNAAKVFNDQNKDFVNVDNNLVKKDDRTMKKFEAITEDLGNLIKEMKDMTVRSRKVKTECIVDLASVDTNKVPGNFNRDVVLKKNKSESSLDSPDLEVSRLMNKNIGSPFCDSSSSLEISGSSMESLNALENQNQHAISHIIPKQVVIHESVESDSELDRRKDVALSTESSIESTSEPTPVNTNLLNMSVSSNESVSPIIFGKKKKIHDSLSSLEASMSSLDSGKQEKLMVTSADSGIEYSLQHPSESKDDNSSNEGTLTHNSSLKESVKKVDHETLTPSPKRTSSLLDVPALKTKGLDRIRKISLVGPSSSFHIPRVETEKDKPSHLEKLLSLFQHPTSLFSRGSQSDEEKKSASNTPPRKDSSLTSSFWSWGSTIEKEREEKEDSSEATDSTLSERVQVSFVDESFSKRLDSKTPSTDTDNTLSEFQTFPTQTIVGDSKVTDVTTDENLVQKCLGLSLTEKSGSLNKEEPKASDTTDLSKPNDLNRNYEVSNDSNRTDEKIENKVIIDDKDEAKAETIRPRSFAAVLKSSGSENSLDKQSSPERSDQTGQSVDKLPSKIIRGIKENISPENTLTSSMTNTKTLALELTERQIKTQPIVNAVWEVPLLDKIELKTEDVKAQSDLAPIATIDETCDEAADNTVNVKLEYIDDVKNDTICTEVETRAKDKGKDSESIDLGKDALSYLVYESQDFEPDLEQTVARTQVKESSLAQELKEAAIKELQDLSPELIIDEAIEIPEVYTGNEMKTLKSSPVIPERAKFKKSNSLEDLSQREETEKSSPKTKSIAFKIPETTSPRDIPERRTRLRTTSGSSPKSLPESLNKPCPLTKIDSALKKRKKVSSLGKMAKDSLLALNISEDEIAEYRRSYATSAESLRSLESVSEDANSQSGTSVDSRCRSCLRTSQESLMSLDSITEDCKCGNECEKSNRSVR